MINIEEIVTIKYKDSEFYGYLTLNKEKRIIDFLINNDQYKGDLQDTTLKNFHCVRSNGIIYSFFNCILIQVKNSNNFKFQIGIFFDNYVDDLENLKLNRISAYFPKIDSIFPSKELHFSTKIIFRNEPIEIIAERITTQENKISEQVVKSGLSLTIQSEEKMGLEFIDGMLARICCLFSFLFKKYVSYEYIFFKKEEDFWPINIYQRNQYLGNEIDLFNNNFGLLRNIDKDIFERIFIPINSPFFQVWHLYASTLRVDQLLESKYLDYVRCLEIISRHFTETNIYDEAEVREKLKAFKKSVNNMDLDKEYKNNLKNQFIYCNKKPFKSILNELLTKYQWSNKMNNLLNGPKEMKNIINTIVDLRDYLTHGNSFDLLISDAVIFYCELVHEFLIALMLNEYGFDYEYYYKKTIKNHIPDQETHLINLLELIKNIPDPIIK